MNEPRSAENVRKSWSETRAGRIDNPEAQAGYEAARSADLVLAAILAYDPRDDDPTDLLSRAYNEIETLRRSLMAAYERLAPEHPDGVEEPQVGGDSVGA